MELSNHDATLSDNVTLILHTLHIHLRCLLLVSHAVSHVDNLTDVNYSIQ